MLEPREWRGRWWDPRAPETQVAGVLTFSQSDAELELIGVLPDLEQEDGSLERMFGLVDRPRIHGLTTDGKEITLDRCIPRGPTIGAGVPVERHHPGVILVGHHFEGEIDLNAIEIRFTHLDEWAGLSGFSESLDWTDDKTVEAIKVEFRPPEDVTAALADGTTIEVGFAWTWSGRSFVTTRAEIEQRAGIVVRFPHPRQFDEALKLVGRLRNFLNLAVGKPVHPRAIGGILDAEPHENEEADDPRATRTRVEIFYALADQPQQSDLDRREVLPHEMRFTLAAIHDSLDHRLQTWLNRYDTLRPALDLYFGVAYGAVRYLEPRFLSLMQALETYHRRTSSSTLLPEEEHTEWLASVLGAIADEASRNRLAKILEHSNEPRLRARLKDVLTYCPQVTQKIAGKKGKFLQAAVTERNYLTHYDPALEAQAPKGIELLPLAAQVGALLEMCLLREIDFTCGEIDTIFTRIRRYDEIDHLTTRCARRVAPRSKPAARPSWPHSGFVCEAKRRQMLRNYRVSERVRSRSETYCNRAAYNVAAAPMRAATTPRSRWRSSALPSLRAPYAIATEAQTASAADAHAAAIAARPSLNAGETRCFESSFILGTPDQ